MDISAMSGDASGLLASTRLPAAGLERRQRAFMEAMGRHGVGVAAGDDADGGRGVDEARRAAEQFVATTFLMPLLKEVRAQNRAAAPFGPTQAEKTLGPLMDAELADRMVRSSQFGLVERVASELRGVGRREERP